MSSNITPHYGETSPERIYLNFVCALPSEARPIIEHYALQRSVDARHRHIYRAGSTQLIVSGVGKLASACAVGHLAALTPASIEGLWLNVGIAGHSTRPQGAIGIAHSITDKATSKNYYPAIAFAAPCASYAVSCFDQPTTTYDGDALCDMESSGFISAASRYSSVEFCHVLKVVSDNSASDFPSLNRERISELVGGSINVIEQCAHAMTHLAKQTYPSQYQHSLDETLGKWHFTATQKLQLRDLARRWSVLFPARELPLTTMNNSKNAREALRRFENALSAQASVRAIT